MNHKITTTVTGNEWKQVMICEFANSSIAKLVLEDASTDYRGHKLCLLASGESKAELQHEGKVVTVTCRFVKRWHSDPDTNKDALEALAKDWEAQEQAWLPIARYLTVRVKPGLKRTLEITNKLIDEIAKLERRIDAVDNLEYRIKELERNLTALDNQHTKDILGIYKELRNYGEALTDLQDAFSLHRELRFHFLGGKK